MHTVAVGRLGDDKAVVETYATAVERKLGPDQDYIDDVIGLRYLDRFDRRESTPWRIAHRTVVIDWTRAHVVDEGWLATQAFERGKRDRTDYLCGLLDG